MRDEGLSIRDALASSVTGGEFTSAMLWGALAAGVVAVIEYNVSASGGTSIEIQYSMLVGGAIAGIRYAGPRETAVKAGALVAGLPVLLLGPIAYALPFAAGGPLSGWTLAAGAVVFFLVLPLFVGFTAAFGALSAYVTHWLVEQLLGPRTIDAESAH